MSNRLFSYIAMVTSICFTGIILLANNEVDFIWHQILGGLVILFSIAAAFFVAVLIPQWKEEDKRIEEYKRDKKDN